MYAAGDFRPDGARRDEEVAAGLEAVGAGLALVGSPDAVAPLEIVKRAGTPYRVFTPCSRA